VVFAEVARDGGGRNNGAAARLAVRELLPANDNSANSIGIVFGMVRAPAIAMNVARRFEDLIVWQLAVRIRNRVYALTEAGAASRDFKFRDQTRDSASSVPSNISKGLSALQPTAVRAITEHCERIAWRDSEPSAPWQREEIFLRG
jgi:hypothetical protein